MQTFESIKKQALSLARTERRRRRKNAARRKPVDPNALKLIRVSSWAGKPLTRRQIYPHYRPWAEEVAPLLSYREWLDIAHQVEPIVSLGWFENIFSNLRTRDGDILIP